MMIIVGVLYDLVDVVVSNLVEVISSGEVVMDFVMELG